MGKLKEKIVDSDKQKIEHLKKILAKIQFVEFEDADDGLIIFCPICGGYPEPERLSFGQKNQMTPYRARNGKGHDKECEIFKVLFGPE